MQKILSISFSLALLLAACAPVATPVTSQVANETPAASATAMTAPTSTIQVQAEATKKPKGQKSQTGTPSAEKQGKGKGPLPAPTSSNPNFVAPEISGRPTDTSITINVVPVRDMQITVGYGPQNGLTQTVVVNGKANTPT